MARLSKSEVACFFLTGTVVGASIALLYAPKTGAQTRRGILKYSKRTVGRLDDLQENIRDQITTWVDDIGCSVKDGLNVGKKFGTASYGQVMEVFDNAKKAVEDGKNHLQRVIKTA